MISGDEEPIIRFEEDKVNDKTQDKIMNEVCYADMSENEVSNIFRRSLKTTKNYDVLMQVTPKKNSSSKTYVYKKLPNSTLSKTNKTNIRTNIQESISQINKIVVKLDNKNLDSKKKAASVLTKQHDCYSPEMKLLKKDVINLVLEGEDLLKQVFKSNQLHKNCKVLAGKDSNFYCTCNASFSGNQQLRKVLNNMRKKLLISLECLERNTSKTGKNLGGVGCEFQKSTKSTTGNNKKSNIDSIDNDERAQLNKLIEFQSGAAGGMASTPSLCVEDYQFLKKKKSEIEMGLIQPDPVELLQINQKLDIILSQISHKKNSTTFLETPVKTADTTNQILAPFSQFGPTFPDLLDKANINYKNVRIVNGRSTEGDNQADLNVYIDDYYSNTPQQTGSFRRPNLKSEKKISYNHSPGIKQYTPGEYINHFYKDQKQIELEMYQRKLRQEGVYRQQRTEKLRSRIGELRNYLITIKKNVCELAQLQQCTGEDRLIGVKGMLQDSLQCLYSLKMIFLSPECFNDECVGEIDKSEKDLRGGVSVCDSMCEITTKSKSDLLEGIFRILQKNLNGVLSVSEGKDLSGGNLAEGQSKLSKTLVEKGEDGEFFIKKDSEGGNKLDEQKSNPGDRSSTPEKTYPKNSPVEVLSNKDTDIQQPKKDQPIFNKKEELLIDKTIDSNNPAIPANLIETQKLKIPKRENVDNTLLTATVIKLVDSQTFAVGFSDGSLGFYNLDNFAQILTSYKHKVPITCLETLEFKSDKLFLLSGSSEEESSIIVWDCNNNFKAIKRQRGHDKMISSIRDLQDNGTVATASFDGKIVFWDFTNNFNNVQILDDNTGPVTCQDFSKDDNLLISGSIDGFILIYRIAFEDNQRYSGCELMHKFSTIGHVIELTRCFQKPNFLLSLESDFVIRLYDIQKKEIVAQIAHDGPVMDFLVVESELDMEPLVFAMDNRYNLVKFDLENQVSMRNKIEKKLVELGKFVGYSPKNQVIVKGNKVFLLSLNQIECAVSLYKQNTNV